MENLASTTLKVVRPERDHNRMACGFLDKANCITDRDPPALGAALKIDDDDVFDLMHKASTVRHEFPLLKIAANLTLS